MSSSRWGPVQRDRYVVRVPLPLHENTDAWQFVNVELPVQGNERRLESCAPWKSALAFPLMREDLGLLEQEVVLATLQDYADVVDAAARAANEGSS